MGKRGVQPDGMLVEVDHLLEASKGVAQMGPPEALSAIGRTEPALAAFIAERLCGVAGRLALTGAPAQVVQGSHEDVLALVLTCVQALRRGHYELWKDTFPAAQLAQFDPTLQPKTRRRKKAQGGAEETGAA